MRELSTEALQSICSIKPRELYKDIEIPEALAILRKYSEAKPYNTIIRPTLDLGSSLAKSRDYTFLKLLLQDCAEWLTFFHHSVLYRSLLHADEIITGINDRAFARIPVATRALLELFLYTYTTYKYIYKMHKETKAPAPDQSKRAVVDQIKVRDYLLKQSMAARINWDDPFGSNWKEVRQQLHQTNVVTLLDKLPDDQRDTVKRWYALLSDACHPNFGSILFVLDYDQMKDNPPTFAFTRASTSPTHFQLAIDLVAAPLGFSCIQLVQFLTFLEQVFLDYQEKVTQLGSMIDRGERN